MANRILLLCLFLSCLFINLNLIECRGGGHGGGHSGGHGHSSGGHSHSSGGHGWGRSWGSSSGSHSWSSGSGSKSSSSWGSSSGSHSYPASTGLSGSGSSGSWWSSSSSGSHSYPASTGLSGSGSSGSSWSSNWGSSSSGSHSYPASTGLSGSGSSSSSYGYGNRNSYGSSYHPSYSYNTHSQSNYGSGYHYVPSTYYSSPQYVYVTEYRNSDSRYNDLLTGLTLYNMGRSHSNYHDHYYYDDYYRQRHYTSSSSSNSHGASNKPQTAATCILKIKKDYKEEVLKIPCEIVSTFTEGSRKQSVSTESHNKTVCVTNTTVTNNTIPTNSSSMTSNEMSNFTMASNGTLVPFIAGVQNETLGNSTVHTNGTMQNSVTTNITSCISTVNVTDPLKVKGPSVNASNMECIVEIHTNDALFSYNVSCNTLMEYSKMKEQKSSIMPSREKLQNWLNKPPWWLSMFIAL